MKQSSPPIDIDPSRGRRRVRLATLLGIALVAAYSVMPLIRRNASLGDVHTDLQAILVDWILFTALAVIGFGAEGRTQILDGTMLLLVPAFSHAHGG